MSWRARLLIVSFVFLTLAIPAQGSSLSAAGNPMTVRTILTLGDDPQGDGPIFLAGLAQRSGTQPTVLAANWSSEQTSWFPTWYVILSSAEGIVGQQGIRVGPVAPTRGHTYEAVLSYDPTPGVVAFSLFDLTLNQRLINEDWQVAKYAGPMVAVAAETSELSAFPWYEPVGIKWDIVTGPDDEVLATRILEPNSRAWVRLTTKGDLPGEFRLVTGDEPRTVLTAGQVVDGGALLPMVVSKLPLGSSVVTLQYILDDQLLWADPRPITVGKVSLAFEAAAFADEQHVLEQTVRVGSQSFLSGVTLKVKASIHSLEWDAARGSYVPQYHSTQVVDLSSMRDIPAGVSFTRVSIPVPEEPGLWQVDFSVSALPALATELLAGGRVGFSTTTGSMAATSQFAMADARSGLRIGTYNVYLFQGWPEDQAAKVLGSADDPRRLSHFTSVLSSLGCDILAIQEGASVDKMRQLAQRLNVNLAAFPSATVYTGGVFTGYSIVESRTFNQAGPRGVNEPFSRFGGAALLDIEGRLLWVVNIHAHAHSEEMRAQEAVVLGRQLDGLLQVTPHVVVLGDFNSRVGAPIHRSLLDRGLRNALEIRSSTGLAPIDHIYVSETLVPYVRLGWVVSDPGFRLPGAAGPGVWVNSDHLPVIVEIEWP